MSAQVVLLILFLVCKPCFARLFHQYSHLPQFEPEQVAQRFAEVLNNQHLVMVGDSLMRYQYISLLHLLHFGKFPEMMGHSNILIERTFPLVGQFFGNISAVLAPNGFCDCRREDHYISFAPFYENRYYRDEARNITVTYIMYFGDNFDIHGHYRSDGRTGELYEEDWEFSKIYHLLEHLHKLVSPPPAILLLNAGFHPNR